MSRKRLTQSAMHVCSAPERASLVIGAETHFLKHLSVNWVTEVWILALADSDWMKESTFWRAASSRFWRREVSIWDMLSDVVRCCSGNTPTDQEEKEDTGVLEESVNKFMSYHPPHSTRSNRRTISSPSRRTHADAVRTAQDHRRDAVRRRRQLL